MASFPSPIGFGPDFEGSLLNVLASCKKELAENEQEGRRYQLPVRLASFHKLYRCNRVTQTRMGCSTQQDSNTVERSSSVTPIRIGQA